MRQIVLDTETTGLDPLQGHKIIEIGCVEIENRRLTGRHFHCYLNPDREIDDGAVQVHGITSEFLADKPRFHQVAEELLAFIGGAELIIHNAAFDLGFLNHELNQTGQQFPSVESQCAIVDTLLMARKKHPGQRNSLDALCKRYEVDNSQRDLHGALLDAEILADVYLRMTGGQTTLQLQSDEAAPREQERTLSAGLAVGVSLRVAHVSDEEHKAHEAFLARIDAMSQKRCLWLQDPERQARES